MVMSGDTTPIKPKGKYRMTKMTKRIDASGRKQGPPREEGKSNWKDEKNKRSETMSDLKDKAKEKIDDAAEAAKKTAEKIVDKSKDAAHSAGKKLEQGGKRLQDA